MEIISAISGVITICKLTQEIPEALKIIHTLTNMDEDMMSLVNEVNALQGPIELLDEALASSQAEILPALLQTNIPVITSTTSKLEQIMKDLKQLAEDCQQVRNGRTALKPKRFKWIWNQERLRRLREEANYARGNLTIVMSAVGLRQNQ
jgi:hypothetical protein